MNSCACCASIARRLSSVCFPCLTPIAPVSSTSRSSSSACPTSAARHAITRFQFAFSVYDLDGSGYIDSSELRKIICATNMSTDKQIERKVEWLMRQCDTDGDGNISFEEFTTLSKKFPNIVFPAFNLAGSMAGMT